MVKRGQHPVATLYKNLGCHIKDYNQNEEIPPFSAKAFSNITLLTCKNY